MNIEYSKEYLRSLKRILKRRVLSKADIDETIKKFKTNPYDSRLHFKKISCKRDKNRHSIRILNTQYRILLSVIDDLAVFICICDQDDYDLRNRKC